MKTLQLTTNAEATYVRNQVDVLRNRGIECDVVAVPHSAGSDGRSPLEYLRFCPQVRRRLSSEHDLVHANYGLTIPAALTQRQVPVVASLVGSDLMGGFGPVTSQVARFCDEVIVVSEEMAELLPRGAEVIPYGIDLDQFRPMDQDQARERVGWPTDRYCVLFPYHPDRGVKNYPLARQVVDQATATLGEPVDLRVATGLDYAAMPAYMNAADALLLTSHREGSPSTVKEALACNTPVVSTPVGDVPMRLADVTPSALGTSADELAAGLCAVVEADEESNGRDAVADLGLERMGERLLDVYERAVSETTVPTPEVASHAQTD